MTNSPLSSNQKIQIAGAAILLLCVFKLPIGFYTIVRVVTTIISAYFAYEYYRQHKKELALTFLIVVVLFQPFFKLTLGRDVWLFLDIAVAALLLFLAFKESKCYRLLKQKYNELRERY